MKRILLPIIGLGLMSTAALAADPAVEYQPVETFSWAGFYIGAHVGYGFGDKGWVDPFFGDPRDLGSHDPDGALGGLQIGFNAQSGAFVYGAEADVSWAGIEGSHIDITTPENTLDSEIDTLGTIAGRLGYSFDRWLIYGKVGGAWATEELGISSDARGRFAEADETRWGWMVGLGTEVAIDQNWSLKLEYNYMDFGDDSVTFACGDCLEPSFDFDVDQSIQAVKLGVNYRF